MTFAPRFSPDEKIIMSFVKTEPDIFTMDLNGAKRITEHSSIDISPSFSPDGKFIALTLIEVVYNKFTLCEAMAVM